MKQHLFNMKNTVRYFIIWALLISSTQIRAQQHTILTREEAVSMAINSSTSIKEYNERLNTSEYQKLIADDSKLPQINLQGSYYRLSNNITPYKIEFPFSPGVITLNPQVLNQFNARLNVTQVLFDGQRIRENSVIALHKQRASAYELEKNKTEAAWQTTLIYYSIVKLYSLKEALTKEKEKADSNLNLIVNFEKFGKANTNDVLRGKLQVSNIQLLTLQNDNQLKAANLLLAIYIGISKDSLPSIDINSSTSDEKIQSLNNYLQLATESRDDIKSIEENIDAANGYIKLAKSSRYPKISVSGNLYDANPNSRTFPAQDRWTGTWDAGVNLSYNITSFYTSRHTIKLAKSEQQVLEYKKSSLSDDISREVETSYNDYLYSLENIKVTSEALNQSKENYKIILAKYSNGKALASELIDAQTYQFIAQVNLANAVTDKSLNYYKLLKSTGKTK